ncbi:hypothetical protein C8F01DRAFT_1138049 [Mycena amicta]|nr:hypothetical protein C8F01DRAFT_1138049 [Mycena amicta]
MPMTMLVGFFVGDWLSMAAVLDPVGKAGVDDEKDWMIVADPVELELAIVTTTGTDPVGLGLAVDTTVADLEVLLGKDTEELVSGAGVPVDNEETVGRECGDEVSAGIPGGREGMID